MNAQLARAMIQRQHRGVTPPRTITAPLTDMRDHTTEADRLATFAQSARTRGGKVAPFHPQSDGPLRLAPAPAGFPKPATIRIRAYQPAQQANALFAQRYAAEAVPDAYYDNDLREGFALKYQEEA